MKYFKAILFIILIFSSMHVMAETRALVVGINKYDHLPDLYGAVNDANLIEDALIKNKTKKIIKLINEKATKQAIYKAWITLLAASSKGDVLIFTYSGHGGFEKDRDNEVNELEGKDQNFLLSNFSPSPRISKISQRILDDEIHDLFYKAKDKGVNIIFVADSCYSGSMTRSLSTRAMDTQRYDYSDRNMPPPNTTRIKPIVEDDLLHVIFFFSSDDKLTTPEYEINKKAHGMLSWAFANALLGKAKNKNGKLTIGELKSYLHEIVMTKTKSVQIIGSKTKGHEDMVLFAHNELRKVTSLPDDYREPIIYISPEIKEKLLGAKITNKKESADFSWNPKTGKVLNNFGDTITQGIDGINKMHGVISKWKLLQYIRNNIISGHYAKSCLYEKTNQVNCPPNTYHELGDEVVFGIDKIKYPYLTQFNLAGDGTIQFLYPMGREVKNKIKGSFRLPLNIVKPYGGDQLVSIFTNKPLTKLHEKLTESNNKKNALSLLSTFKTSLQKEHYQLSIIDSYTQ